MLLAEKVALITGGATGIGGATSTVFAREGAKVVIADVNEVDGPARAEAIAADGGSARFVRTDMTSASSVRDLMAAIKEEFGRLDALVSCAGIFRAPHVQVDDFEEDTWDQVIDVNLKGTFIGAKFAVPLMKQSGGGVILLVGSIAGVTTPSGSLAYGASKGGVNGFGITLENFLEPHNIRVNVVCPTDISTPLKLQAMREISEIEGHSADEDAAERASLGDPEGIGKVLAVLASDNCDYVRGMIITK